MSDTSSERLQALQQAEEALQNCDQLLRLVWECASDAMALSTCDGTVLTVNPAYYQLYGFQPEEVIGKNFAIIFPKEQQKWAQVLYERMFTSSVIGPPIETPVTRFDGTERFVESRYTFLTPHGQRTAMLSIIHDITAQKKVEEELWVSEEKLHLALKASQIGTWDWDIVSNAVCWSANLKATFALIPGNSDVSYEAFLELVHPQDRTLVDQEVKCALEQGSDYTIEFRTVLLDSTIRWARMLGQVFSNEVGKAIRTFAVVMDITQGKQDVSTC